ncbi:MAG: sensor domain-containing diguanylate cyclase [Planctomycetales bacterium]
MLAHWINTLSTYSDQLTMALLASVCLVQYYFSMRRLEETLRMAASYQALLQGMEAELALGQKERGLIRLETQILRDFIGEPDAQRAIRSLLQRFLPSRDKGFAGFLQMRPEPHMAFQCGWELDLASEIVLEPLLMLQLTAGKTVHLLPQGNTTSEIWRWFPTLYRRQIQELYLFPIRSKKDQRNLSAVLITTNLIPGGTSPAQQIDLIDRVLSSVATAFEQQQSLELHRQQLRWTSDMLELHALADQKTENPVQMTQSLVDRLSEMIGADRGSLYFGGQLMNRVSPDQPLTPLVSWGTSFQPGVREIWQQYEGQLVTQAVNQGGCIAFDRKELEERNICSLMGTAMTMPLIQNKKTIGVLCFVRKNFQSFTVEQQQLVQWAGEFLANQILRTINQAYVEREARLDGLTKLANRRTFDLHIAKEMQMCTENGIDCSLILLDLDHFKSVNDTYGHQAGDQVLRKAAEVLREQTQKTRSGDRTLCARYGGEELAVVLPAVGAAGAQRIAEEIRRAIEETAVMWDDFPIHVTISAGVASCPQHGTSVEELIAAADSGLYAAKKQGRNQVVVPQPAVAEPVG